MAILYFSDILRKVDIDPAKVKLIRHSLNDAGFEDCYKKGLVYEYTRHQKVGFSKNYEYWAVFISAAGTYAQFFCLYRVGDSVPDTADLVPESFPEREAKGYDGTHAVFQLEPVSALREYEGRLTIDWGQSTLMWHQKGSTPKPVVYILPDRKKEFSGFEDLLLSFDELKEILDNSTVYEAWHTALKSVYAIYLIVDRESGMQYIGSASGDDGLLGRWKSYIETGHGGNKKMRALLEEHPDRVHQFQFSVLQILPKTMKRDDIIELESLYKKKFLSIQFGLNDN